MFASHRRLAALFAAVLFAGCTRGPATLGSLEQDGPPLGKPPVDIAAIPNAVPKPEPLSQYGNPDHYEVLGSEYFVLESAQGFSQTGMASWYGRKFHGNRTSSGEKFDMYKMTAAHRTLPLPTYVRVTNLDNDREVVVKVNDRGPFHSNRIIDLSYAAAVKLGMIKTGTARVRIEAITVDARHSPDPEDPGFYLQTGAFAHADNAHALAAKMKDMGLTRVFIQPTADARHLYRVRVGPFGDADQLAAARSRLQTHGIKSNTLRN